jgi:hypothetical protein
VFSMPDPGPTGISNVVAFLLPLFLHGKGSNPFVPCRDPFLHCTKENSSFQSLGAPCTSSPTTHAVAGAKIFSPLRTQHPGGWALLLDLGRHVHDHPHRGPFGIGAAKSRDQVGKIPWCARRTLPANMRNRLFFGRVRRAHHLFAGHWPPR